MTPPSPAGPRGVKGDGIVRAVAGGPGLGGDLDAGPPLAAPLSAPGVTPGPARLGADVGRGRRSFGAGAPSWEGRGGSRSGRNELHLERKQGPWP